MRVLYRKQPPPAYGHLPQMRRSSVAFGGGRVGANCAILNSPPSPPVGAGLWLAKNNPKLNQKKNPKSKSSWKSAARPCRVLPCGQSCAGIQAASIPNLLRSTGRTPWDTILQILVTCLPGGIGLLQIHVTQLNEIGV